MYWIVLTSYRPHIGRSIFLEQQLERVDIIKLNTGHTAYETLGHRLVAADVHVLDVVELSVGRVFDVEVELFRLVAVHLRERKQSKF